MNEFPESIKVFADTFVEMQIERTLADYYPATRLGRNEVMNNIRKVVFFFTINQFQFITLFRQ